MKRNIWGLNLQELETWVVGNGFPRFRAKQLRDYLYKRHIFHFDEMTQFSQKMRDWLKENGQIDKPVIISRAQSDDEKTIKLLLKLKMAPWLRPFVCVTIMEILFASPPRSAVQWDVYLRFHKKRVGKKFNGRRNSCTDVCI